MALDQRHLVDFICWRSGVGSLLLVLNFFLQRKSDRLRYLYYAFSSADMLVAQARTADMAPRTVSSGRGSCDKRANLLFLGVFQGNSRRFWTDCFWINLIVTVRKSVFEIIVEEEERWKSLPFPLLGGEDSGWRWQRCTQSLNWRNRKKRRCCIDQSFLFHTTGDG